jgi:hypothetical protein
MDRRTIRIVGVVFLLWGCLSGLYLAVKIANARIEGIFSTIASDSPSNQFEHLRCPFLLSRGEAATVAVTIANPTGEDLDYSVHIEGRGFDIGPPGKELEVEIPGGLSTEIAWTVTAGESGNQAIVVQAISSIDAALPGPFHMWPTSFREGCGIPVINGPLTGKQVLVQSLASVLVGAAMVFPRLYAKLGRRVKGKQLD